jgi:hypothetical protein
LSYIAIAFVVLSVFVGALGRDRKLGFWGFFFLSLVFTPLLIFLILVFTKSQPPAHPRKSA